MSRDEKIAAITLGAAAALAVYRYFNMTAEEREALFDKIKERTVKLLGDVDLTVKKVNSYLERYDNEEENAWVDKLYILKKMFRELYAEEKKL